MKHINIMIKPASSLCNLRCRYCFYEDVSSSREIPSYGVMKADVMSSMLLNIRNSLTEGDRVTFAFQGGEPTVAGLDYFKNFVEITDTWKEISVAFALQTNGTLLNGEWCTFLKEHQFLVGLSWDLLPDCHNEARVDAVGKGTEHIIEHTLHLLNSSGIEYNILCTLTNFVARHPDKVWRQIQKYNIRYVQFTPCLDFLDSARHSSYALTPRRFFSFYDQLFTLWIREFQKGNYVSVKLFDDIVNLLAYGIPTACGINGFCGKQLVVEADGSVYPCDFYCLPTYKMGHLNQKSLQEICESPQASLFLARDKHLPELCTDCTYNTFCHGNCERMRSQIGCENDTTFCGYQAFLNAHGKELSWIATLQQRSQE